MYLAELKNYIRLSIASYKKALAEYKNKGSDYHTLLGQQIAFEDLQQKLSPIETVTLQQVKQQVAENHSYPNWDDLNSNRGCFTDDYIDEAMELYLLLQAEAKIKEQAFEFYKWKEDVSFVDAEDWEKFKKSKSISDEI